MRLLTRFALLLLVSTAAASRADADSLLSLSKPTTGSGYWNGPAGEVFPFANINDGRYDDTGSAGDWSFWLGRDRMPGEFVTIDLGEIFNLTSFVLQNTHNRSANDRGTRDFILETSLDGSVYTTAVSATLASVFGTGNSIPLETFALSTPVLGRYVKFTAVNFYTNGAGLNELSVYGNAIIPEPTSLLMSLTGVACLIPALRRRLDSTQR